ncbi:MAG: DDE-type integrase/transposase/recombinase, partial [Actinomycetota bacterium]|nr:DDE-type integrase/transposase/recombinase [Actinomycetota bacterium]
AQRGRLVRDLAVGEHPGPKSRPVRVSRSTIYRWMKDYRDRGFDALVPAPRQVQPLSDVQLLDLAVRLKRENPKRAATHICELITAELASRGDGRALPSARTVQRHFARLGLNSHPAGAPRKVRGRFEADARNDRWVGDGMHGPTIGDRKAILLAFADDHSRLVVGHHWGWAEDTVRLEAALRRGLAARGIPRQIYVDNGSAFISAPLHRACAVLGIQVAHSTPGQPQGRGKIERFFRTLRAQFLVEVEHRGVDSLDQLRRLFTAWLERRYHRRVHSETGQTPLERFTADGIPHVPGPELLREAFLWSTTRVVTKAATVSFLGNRYEVDPALVGHRVELIYDPFDLTRIEIRWNGQSFGTAVPHHITADVHPQVVGRRDHDHHQPPAPTGIDYLALIEAEHRQATRSSINYADLNNDEQDSL